MSKNYLTGEEIERALEEHLAGDSTRLAECARLLARGVGHYLRGRGYAVDQDQMVGETYLAMLSCASKFVPGRGSCFGYMTTCVINWMRQIARAEGGHDRMVAGYRDFLAGERSSGRRVSRRDRPDQ